MPSLGALTTLERLLSLSGGSNFKHRVVYMLIHTHITKNRIYENPAFTILLLFFTEKELLLKQFLKKLEFE